MSEYMSENIAELAKALATAQGKITFALKDSVADMGQKGGRRKYADLQSVIDAIKQALTESEIAYTQCPMPCANGISLRTTLLHSSGQWIASQIDLPIDRMGGIQGMGSALTYARRYALSAMVGVAPDEDDDGQAAQDAYKAQRRQEQPRRAPTPATAQNVPQQAAQPQIDPALKAKMEAVWDKVRAAGFQSRQDGMAALSSVLGKPVQGLTELSLADCEACLAAEIKPADSPF